MAVFVGDDDEDEGGSDDDDDDDDDGDDDDDRSERSQSYMVKRHYIIGMFRRTSPQWPFFLCEVHAHCVP